MSVHTGLYESYWAKDFSQQIVVLTRSNSDSAYIRLNPADLGPVQVTLNVADGQASASFVSQDERVRAAIEAALGDLKDALAKSGVSLTNTYVGSQSNPDRRGDEQFKPKKYLDFPDEQVAPTRAISSNVRSIGIDVFA
jgi:flagellar hook-length control protein FliK